MLLAATGDDRLDPSLANLLAVFVMVVAAIGVERIRTLRCRLPVGGFASPAAASLPVRRVPACQAGSGAGVVNVERDGFGADHARDVTSVRVTAFSGPVGQHPHPVPRHGGQVVAPGDGVGGGPDSGMFSGLAAAASPPRSTRKPRSRCLYGCGGAFAEGGGDVLGD